jgi:hypothetical protein
VGLYDAYDRENGKARRQPAQPQRGPAMARPCGPAPTAGATLAEFHGIERGDALPPSAIVGQYL